MLSNEDRETFLYKFKQLKLPNLHVGFGPRYPEGEKSGAYVLLDMYPSAVHLNPNRLRKVYTFLSPDAAYGFCKFVEEFGVPGIVGENFPNAQIKEVCVSCDTSLRDLLTWAHEYEWTFEK